MARIRKLNKDRDGDAILSMTADQDDAELWVVGGSQPYITTSYKGAPAFSFSGARAMLAIAEAIKKAVNGKD